MQRHTAEVQPETSRISGRIDVIDIARGTALVAMAIYHFGWDLEFFGYAPAGMTTETGWRLFARSIASSFLFLVGVSLVLAHGAGIRWPGFRKRFLQVVAAALAITIATRIAVPEGFIFFGILHQIAFASVAGLLFLRLPALLILAVAASVIAAPHFLRSEAFDHPAFWWLGLSSRNPPSNDYVPVFPWFGAVLIGMAAAKLAQASGLFARLEHVTPGRWSAPLRFAGLHSLAVYLIHQPVLIGLVFLATMVVPPPAPDRAAEFTHSCEAQCASQRDEPFCISYCACMLTSLQSDNRLEDIYGQPAETSTPPWLDEMAWQCALESDRSSGDEAESGG
ncbi:MAG: DUF1624 domain-containing protein [Rhizobiaceae bacterium]|nr:DUF1624 domain-containing protein [Rhizobiaceae bacterium]MCV0408643.1 DUF1624 domain-containing protein [Rhizobiaceae bacterium]